MIDYLFHCLLAGLNGSDSCAIAIVIVYLYVDVVVIQDVCSPVLKPF